MKSYGNLWPRIVSPENLDWSWRYFRRLHAGEAKVHEWEKDKDARLARLRDELVKGVYRPSEYVTFRIYEPKPRFICRAPIRDRVVHHALCAYAVPPIERRFISRTYSCRKFKGTHTAFESARQMTARGGYFLKMDIRHYFDTIDLNILESLLMPLFREKEVRGLFSVIIRSRAGLGRAFPDPDKGLPLGNLTSQWFANLYLDALDHMIVEDLGFGRRYLRYMDDMLLFCDTKEEAWRVHAFTRDWLADNRRVELKEEATRVAPVAEGVPFLGMRIWRDRWRLERKRFRRARRVAEQRYVDYLEGEMDARRLQMCGRSHEGAFRRIGFKGILKHVGEKTLARYGLESADDGLPYVQGDAGDKANSFVCETFWGGSWKWSENHCTAYRCQNVPSNNNNNENGFRLASSWPDSRDAGDKANSFVRGAFWGGSWKYSENHCTAYRCQNRPSNNNNENGFRLASTGLGTHFPGAGKHLSAPCQPRNNPAMPAPRTRGDEHAQANGGRVSVGNDGQSPLRHLFSGGLT